MFLLLQVLEPIHVVLVLTTAPSQLLEYSRSSKYYFLRNDSFQKGIQLPSVSAAMYIQNNDLALQNI